MEPFTFSTYIFLWAGAFFAGFVDSIAGGGGIISLPVLLSTGMPPHLALGTNKLQGSFGSLTAAINYSRKGLVDLKTVSYGIIFTAAGAILGTATIQVLSTEFLNYIIPILLLGVFIYTLLSPKLGETDKDAVLPERVFYLFAGLILGFYDGFFGPGTGSFWALLFVLFLGINLKKATAHTKITNFTSNFISLIVFIIGGNVLFLAGFIMASGQVMGAFFGSKMVIVKGVRFVRFFFLSVVALTMIKIMYSNYF